MKKTSRIDVIGQNGNDGLHYKVVQLRRSEEAPKGGKSIYERMADALSSMGTNALNHPQSTFKLPSRSFRDFVERQKRRMANVQTRE